MLSDLRAALRPALVLTALFALLLGVAYPVALTGIGQALFPVQANGSLMREGGRVIGSTLIGQGFAAPGYFHGRPSAAGTGYDARASAGSNLGPASRALVDRVAAARMEIGASPADMSVPADLVTTSASGLDPHIGPGAALYQVARVAAARRVDAATVQRLVEAAIERPALGFVGEPRVNVLALNRALDRIAPRP